jgi:hypothetical protein
MKETRRHKYRLLARLGLVLLVAAVCAFTVSVTWADDCERDPTDLQDCMRTGTYREVITIIAALLGVSPVVIAHHIVGLSSREIAELVLRDGWDPDTEEANVIRHIQRILSGKGGKAPEFRDLRGPARGPGRSPVDRIYDGTKARRILKDLDLLKDVRRLRKGDPQLQQKLDMMLNRVKDHRRVKAIALDWKKVKLTDGTVVDVLDEDNIVIVVEEPEYKLPQKPTPPAARAPRTGPAPAPKKAPTAGPKPPKPKAKSPPLPPQRSIVDVYKDKPSRFRRCQDLAYGRAKNQPPPKGAHPKADVHQKMKDAKYQNQPKLAGRMTDTDTDAKWSRLQDGDIVGLGINGPPNPKGADHYFVVEKGRIYEVQNLPTRGRYNSLPLKDAKAWFSSRQPMLKRDGTPILGRQSGKPLFRTAYRYFKVYRRTGK